ncbi:MAG: acyl-[acyl-carrier-protein] desaturase [Nocardioidaceae bacterium]|nr:acyl-[acyl-carrier-protein] desaturase [Nocardioidaceae bacterium]
MATSHISQTDLLRELEQVVEGELNRHYGVAKEWFPHDYIPWSDGRNFDGLMGGEAWSPDDADIPDVARSALIVNLLTEDNLPSYHREIATRFGRDGAWGEWVGRWTAEEGRHGIALRDYLVVTRGVDPVELETLRMQHMTAGYESGDKTALQTVAYVSFQELATRVAHRNTGAATGCPLAEQLLARIATDENLHMVFYRNLVAAALDRAPDATMCAIRDEVLGFQMPGQNMPDFARNAVVIAKAGIYDLRLHHDEVLQPVLRFWKVFSRTDFGPEGEQARDEVAAFLAVLDEQAAKFEQARDAARAKRADR